MSYGVGHRHGSDAVLLWLWCRPAAVAPVPPLAWELPYAVGAGLKKKKLKRGVYVFFIKRSYTLAFLLSASGVTQIIKHEILLRRETHI